MWLSFETWIPGLETPKFTVNSSYNPFNVHNSCIKQDPF